jgi:chromosome segregation ATPase
MMSEQRTLLETTISNLKQSRDELRLQLHLAEMDAKEEYKRLTEKVEDLATQYEPVKDAVGDTAENVFAALLLAAGEVKHGFDRVRASFKSK